MYAEECSHAEYVKAKEMADNGAFGRLYRSADEKHSDPTPVVLDAAKSGGGVFVDMGCHGIAFCYWS